MNSQSDTINHIQVPNYEHIALTQPCGLYADNHGCRLEFRARSIHRLIGDVSVRIGVILGLTHSWDGGSQTKTYFLDSQGETFEVGQYSGLTPASLNIMLFYMLLNPIEQLDGWVLQDLSQAKKEHAPKTNPMIGIKSSWGKTETFHPDLEQAMKVSTSILNRIP